jgi:non-specific serine/threonine protein kinase
MPRASVVTPEKFTTFGELLRFLRRKANLTQRELSIAVGYSESQISRLEQNERAPEEATLAARFVTALYIEDEPEWIARLLELGAVTHASETHAPQPIADAKRTPHNLPIQLTSFIGREKEIAEIKKLLSLSSPVERGAGGEGGIRLLTLTGPGGSGKTRLALQSASGLLDDFRDGVWLIELAPLAEPSLVPQTVANTLGLKEEPGRALLATLTDHLRGKKILLILDNCEHLIQASAELADALLHACPNVHILATSREMLGIAGEHTLLVPSLSLPADIQGLQDFGSLSEYEAVRLFVERAVTVMPDFILTNENASAIVQICQRLDGIPLALELAATRVKVLSVKQIAARLTDAFRLLTGGTRTALPRQQTLQAAMDWSYELLSEKEQCVFNRLSVFAGGWTLEAAEAVCADEEIESAEILNLLTQLVNKSLIIVERKQGAETRYRMLEIVRQYELMKLVANGEGDIVRRRHAEYYLVLAETDGPTVTIRLDRMETELDNMRAALGWSQSVMEGGELGLRLAAGLRYFWFIRSYWVEARMWLEGALRHPQATGHSQEQANALMELAGILREQGEYILAQTSLDEAVTLIQNLTDHSVHGWIFFNMGLLAREQGDVATALQKLQKSLAQFQKMGDKVGEAVLLVTLGEVAVMQDDVVLATRLLNEGLALNREVQNTPHIGWALNHLGHVAQLQGEYERATRLHEESLLLFREIRENFGIAHAHQSIGETALAQGSAVIAATHLAEALGLFHDLGDRAGLSWCLAGLAGAATLNEEPERAAWLWAAAEALRQSIGARPTPAARKTHERLQDIVRKQLGEETFNAKWAEGQAASWEQAVDTALSTT